MMELKTFQVRGIGEFPLDMLRSDRCFPHTGADSISIGPYQRGRRTITLAKTTTSKGGQLATLDRWRSYGWHVL